MEEATAGYREAMRKEERFIEEMCQRDDEAWCYATELYRSFATRCDARGPKAGSQKSFSATAEGLNFEKGNHPETRRAIFRGVRLKAAGKEAPVEPEEGDPWAA